MRLLCSVNSLGVVSTPVAKAIPNLFFVDQATGTAAEWNVNKKKKRKKEHPAGAAWPLLLLGGVNTECWC